MPAPTQPQTPPAILLEIRVDNLHKSFGANQVLRGVNLSIPRGEIIAIVGGSGSGKTVLLEHMIGQMRPDQGQVWLADHESPDSHLVDLASLDEAGMDRLRIHWAVVFQSNALYSGTVEENISLALQYVKGLDDAETRKRVRQSIEAVGLNPDEVLPIARDQLSGGMAKRVAIARALALEPLLLFFDEPTTGLDPDHAKLIQDLIFSTYEQDHDRIQRTTLIVTHDKDLLYRLRPRVVMLHDGQIFFDGSYAAFEQSDSPIIRPYFELMPMLHRVQKQTA
jgi:phospholipid/cholesterol/gamma-HCH transport system ATP-binding protein